MNIINYIHNFYFVKGLWEGSRYCPIDNLVPRYRHYVSFRRQWSSHYPCSTSKFIPYLSEFVRWCGGLYPSSRATASGFLIQVIPLLEYRPNCSDALLGPIDNVGIGTHTVFEGLPYYFRSARITGFYGFVGLYVSGQLLAWGIYFESSHNFKFFKREQIKPAYVGIELSLLSN